MTSTSHQETISSLDGQIKEELAKIEQRLRLSSAALSKLTSSSSASKSPSSSSATKNKASEEEEAKVKKLQDEVLQQLGQLYNLFNSRSNSAVSNNNNDNNSRSASASDYQQQQQQLAAAPHEAASLTPTNNNNNTMPPQPRKSSPTPTFSTSHANQPSGSGANLTPTVRSGTPPPNSNPTGTTTAPSLSDYNTQRSASVNSSSAYSSASATPTSRSGSPSSSSSIPRPPPPPAKGGMLWNYGLPSLMRSFKNTYVVISTDHVKWYKSEDSYKNGDKETGSVQLWTVLKNSRGSVIKNTAAGWPFISPQDCPKATDSSRHYFGVQYFDSKDNLQHLVLAANSAEEKREWVNHIAQLIPLQLPPDAPTLPDGQLFIDMATNVVSHHCKKVLDGEAPKF